MEPVVLHQLNSVLRIQLVAVQQHFIHVLILKAWGADEFADRITAIDAVDLPNAMRIVDFIVSNRALPELATDHRTLALQMPKPGSSYEEILASEGRLERQLIERLQAANASIGVGGTPGATHLIADPLSARDDYGRWIQQQIEIGRKSTSLPQRLPDAAMFDLDTLFAHLMVVIEQSLIHSFIHWHDDKKHLADAAWAVSGAAMMQATQITNLLAIRHTAPSPADTVVLKSVRPPRIAGTSDEAMKYDRTLAQHCRAAAESTTRNLVGTEFESVCQQSFEYFQALCDWQLDLDLPEINNPCLNFERVFREYVWKGGTASHASA